MAQLIDAYLCTKPLVPAQHSFCTNWVWHRIVLLALKKREQEVKGFKVILGY